MNVKTQLRYSGSLCDELTCLLLPLVTAHGIVPPSQEERARNEIVHSTWLTASLHFFIVFKCLLSVNLALVGANCHSEWSRGAKGICSRTAPYDETLQCARKRGNRGNLFTVAVLLHHVEQSVLTLKNQFEAGVWNLCAKVLFHFCHFPRTSWKYHCNDLPRKVSELDATHCPIGLSV